ncbi:hypothetical protein ACFW9O_24970 [Streptomyces sp. NPDC059499]|uniref:hypothetical protein n=1 Tax=Streptomyces sp. NPDC059499 TaxID=3346852 RepID=UPI00368C7AD9
MAALAAQSVALAGSVPTYAAAAGGGDTAPVGSNLLLHVINGGGSSVTVTLVTPGTSGGLAIADAAVAVAAGASAFVPLRSVYRNSVTGRAAITYSGVTSVTAAVLRLP